MQTRTLWQALALFCAVVFVLPLATPATSAVNLENLPLKERVKRLEQKMQTDDESPFDSYVSEFGGRIMADFTFNTDQSNALRNSIGLAEDGFEFRRLRLYAEGPIGPQLEYKIQLDFAGNAVEIKDAYIAYSGLPLVDDLTVGHFKEPFSLNELTSSKYITFMARSALSDGFTPEYNPGIQTAFHSQDNFLNFKVGLFQVQDQQQPATGGSYNLSGRITSPLHYSNGGRSLVHAGLSFRNSAEQDGWFTRDLEPEVHKGDPEYLEVAIPAEDHTAYGFELAGVRGPFSVQGEYAVQDISTTAGSDPSLDSMYIFGSYFLTGEHRPYDKGDGTFERIDVRNEWRGMGQPGTGAWEVAARYSTTDFTEAKGISSINMVDRGPSDINNDSLINQADADLLAGEMNVITLGLNWYPHPHAKWMLNYIDAEQDDLGGDAQWVATRFQVDF